MLVLWGVHIHKNGGISGFGHVSSPEFLVPETSDSLKY